MENRVWCKRRGNRSARGAQRVNGIAGGRNVVQDQGKAEGLPGGGRMHRRGGRESTDSEQCHPQAGLKVRMVCGEGGQAAGSGLPGVAMATRKEGTGGRGGKAGVGAVRCGAWQVRSARVWGVKGV